MARHWYAAQEKVFVPGIAGDWPEVIPKPDSEHGRLRRVDGLHELMVAADSELSAIAHGRPINQAEAIRISGELRKIYESW